MSLATRFRATLSSARALLDEFRRDRPLVATGLVALAVLLPGSTWGIPRATSAATVRGWEVDGISGIGVLSELHNLTVAAKGDWYVAYPLLHYLVLGVLYAPYLAFCLVTGRLSSPSPEYPYGFSDPVASIATLVGIGHAVSVLMASGVVMSVFVLTRRLFGQPAAFLAAALSLCTVPLLFYGRSGNLDVPVLFWTMLSFVALERAWTDGATTRRVAACAVFGAMAVATKDQAYGLLLLPMALLLHRAMSARDAAANGANRLRVPVVLVASGVVAFAIAGGVIFRPDRFLRHLEFVASFRETFTNVQHQTDLTIMRPTTVSGRATLLGDYLRGIATATGWPMLIAALSGSVVLWRTTPAVRWLVAAVAGFFVLVILPIEHMQYRYALAPAVVLSIVAAGLAARLRRPGWLFPVVATVLAGAASAGAFEVTHAMVADARYPASRWLAAHAIPGDTLAFFGRPHQLPHIPAGVVAEMIPESMDGADALRRARPRWVIVAPDFFADPSRERSTFLPADVYAALVDGSLGWSRVERFERRGLLGRPIPFLPFVNPAVQVFERRGNE